jgi:hypothetical protein
MCELGGREGILWVVVLGKGKADKAAKGLGGHSIYRYNLMLLPLSGEGKETWLSYSNGSLELRVGSVPTILQ